MPAAPLADSLWHPSRRAPGVAHLGVVRRRPPLPRRKRTTPMETCSPQKSSNAGSEGDPSTFARVPFGRSVVLRFTRFGFDRVLRAKVLPQRRLVGNGELAIESLLAMNSFAATRAFQLPLRSWRTCRARLSHVPRNSAWPAAPIRQQSSEAAPSGDPSHSFPRSGVAPNQAVELTASVRHGFCSARRLAPAETAPHSSGSSPWGR